MDNAISMQNEEQQKLLFVINPVSGGKEKQDWEASIREYFKDSPHSSEFYLLTGESDSVSVQHHIQTVQPDKVIAVGGDGTVKMIAELLKGSDLTLGILPAGSANGMAKELAIPLTKNEALDVVVNGRKTAMDAIQVNNDEICIHLSDIGLNAMLIKYFESSSKRGMFGYAKGVFRMLWNKRKIYATITTDKATYKRKAYMIALANARKYGTGATINPEGAIDDGAFEVVIVRKLNFWGILNALITHKSFDSEKIEIYSTKKVEITTKGRFYFQIDGEYRGKTKKITAQVLPHYLQVMVPKNVES